MCTSIIVVVHQLGFVPVPYIPEGLPLPVTRPTHILLGLWVIPGVAILKVLVGYARPPCEMLLGNSHMEIAVNS